MNEVVAKLRDGTVRCGPMWMWRPVEGYMILIEEKVGPDEGRIWLRDIVSASDRNQRTGRNTDGTAKVENVDLLERARKEGWNGR